MIPHTSIHWETGKYAVFVWTAYGVTTAAFAILTVGSILHARRWRKRFEELNRK